MNEAKVTTEQKIKTEMTIKDINKITKSIKNELTDFSKKINLCRTRNEMFNIHESLRYRIKKQLEEIYLLIDNI
jgi:hypothetical protein